MGMVIYSALLLVGLVAAAPWWGFQMLRSGRYREGLRERLGLGAGRLRADGGKTLWVHAVSVGEVLACERLVGELRAALGAGGRVVVSTTTATGQKVARERFGAESVFFWPLDFGFAVRAWLRVVRPAMVVLVESELWPRMLWECQRAGVPVCVVNARVSDRSFRRTVRVKQFWGWMARRVRVFLAQGEESAGRLRELGVAAERVRVTGNLKFDLPEVRENLVADWIRDAAGSNVIVGGSTLEGEEKLLLNAWHDLLSSAGIWLVLAPRHKERFEVVARLVVEHGLEVIRASALSHTPFQEMPRAREGWYMPVILLDTLGDLAAVYGVASAAFLGGSLVAKGGHNPLEAARFGVPILMGPSYENFREIVEGMRAVEGIRIVAEPELFDGLAELLNDKAGMGAKGKAFYDGQAGATGRTLAALLEVLG